MLGCKGIGVAQGLCPGNGGCRADALSHMALCADLRNTICYLPIPDEHKNDTINTC